MTLSIMTLSTTTFSVTGLSIRTHNDTTLRIMSQYIYSQNNDTRNYDAAS
jgi:hypothetical protein